MSDHRDVLNDITALVAGNNAKTGETGQRRVQLGDGSYSGNIIDSNSPSSGSVNWFLGSDDDSNTVREKGTAILSSGLDSFYANLDSFDGLYIEIAYPPGKAEYYVMRVDGRAAREQFGTAVPVATQALNAAGQQAHTQVSTLKVQAPDSDNPSFVVTVGSVNEVFSYPAAITLKETQFTTGTSDLSTVQAALVADKHTVALVCLDMATNELAYLALTASTSDSDLPNRDAFDAVQFADFDLLNSPAYSPLQIVYLYFGQTGALNNDYISTEVRTAFPPAKAYLALKDKWDATVDPVVTDDSDSGYSIGSRWYNVSTPEEFVCLNATVGTAAWQSTTAGSGGTGDVTGPGSSTTDDIATYADTTGKVIKDSGKKITDLALGAGSSVANDFVQFTNTDGRTLKDGGLSLSTDGTFAGNSDSLIPSQKATKSYVDAIATGLSPKSSVFATTAAALPTNTYSNGVSGVGATLTAVATGVLTVDGLSVPLNAIILVKDEVTQSHNGRYLCTTAGAVGVAYILTRTTDSDTSAEILGSYMLTDAGGSANAGKGFVNSNASTITIGTTAITYVQFSDVTQTVALTGDVTGTGTTSIATTLATVNSNVGIFSRVKSVTANAKGLITAITQGLVDLATEVTGLLGKANGGTGVDLSATGGATQFLAQDGSHVVSARVIADADLPTALAGHTISGGSINNTPIGATTANTAIFSALSVLIGGFKAILTQANTADRTYTLPDATTTLVGTDTTQTLTNKLLQVASGNLEMTSTGHTLSIGSAPSTSRFINFPDENGTVLTTASAIPAALLGVMTGDSGSGGAKGAVPAPATGDATKVFTGGGAYTAKYRRPLFDYFTNAASTATSAEEDLYSDTLAAGQFAADGDKVFVRYGVQFANTARNKRLRAYIAGTAVLDTGAVGAGAAFDFFVEYTAIRASSSSLRIIAARITTSSATLISAATYTSVTGLTLSNAQIVKITSTVSSGAAGDMTARLGTVEYEGAA